MAEIAAGRQGKEPGTGVAQGHKDAGKPASYYLVLFLAYSNNSLEIFSAYAMGEF